MSRTSQRKQIRAAIKTLLLGRTSCGPRVYLNRFTPIWDETFPVIMVYTLGEQASVYNQAPLELQRKLSVSVEVVGEHIPEGPEIDDVLDDVCQEVEDLMKEDHTLGELCGDVMLINSEYQSMQEGDRLVAVARLTYEVTYYSVEVAIDDETVLPNFKKLNTTIKNITGETLAESSQEIPVT